MLGKNFRKLAMQRSPEQLQVLELQRPLPRFLPCRLIASPLEARVMTSPLPPQPLHEEKNERWMARMLTPRDGDFAQQLIEMTQTVVVAAAVAAVDEHATRA
jgi:hypothetical protein